MEEHYREASIEDNNVAVQKILKSLHKMRVLPRPTIKFRLYIWDENMIKWSGTTPKAHFVPLECETEETATVGTMLCRLIEMASHHRLSRHQPFSLTHAQNPQAYHCLPSSQNKFEDVVSKQDGKEGARGIYPIFPGVMIREAIKPWRMLHIVVDHRQEIVPEVRINTCTVRIPKEYRNLWPFLLWKPSPDIEAVVVRDFSGVLLLHGVQYSTSLPTSENTLLTSFLSTSTAVELDPTIETDKKPAQKYGEDGSMLSASADPSRSPTPVGYDSRSVSVRTMPGNTLLRRFSSTSIASQSSVNTLYTARSRLDSLQSQVDELRIVPDIFSQTQGLLIEAVADLTTQMRSVMKTHTVKFHSSDHAPAPLADTTPSTDPLAIRFNSADPVDIAKPVLDAFSSVLGEFQGFIDQTLLSGPSQSPTLCPALQATDPANRHENPITEPFFPNATDFPHQSEGLYDRTGESSHSVDVGMFLKLLECVPRLEARMNELWDRLTPGDTLMINPIVTTVQGNYQQFSGPVVIYQGSGVDPHCQEVSSGPSTT